MWRRKLQNRAEAALADTPVLMLVGARQVGKTTLAQTLIADRSGTYYTLDDLDTLTAAKGDPKGFIAAITAEKGTVSSMKFNAPRNCFSPSRPALTVTAAPENFS